MARHDIQPLRNKKPLLVKDAPDGNNVLPLGDRSKFNVALAETFGTSSTNLNWILISQAAALVDIYKKPSQKVNLVLETIHEIGPKDPIEAMLVTQMFAIHNAAMTCVRRASLEEQPEHLVTEYINRATKLSRTYATQMEALLRYRGRGQQRVTVKHVHVNSGGQAIVGNVGQTESKGEGGNGKS